MNNAINPVMQRMINLTKSYLASKGIIARVQLLKGNRIYVYASNTEAPQLKMAVSPLGVNVHDCQFEQITFTLK